MHEPLTGVPTVMFTGSVDVVPPGFCAVAVRLCVPLVNGIEQEKLPPAVAVVLHKTTPFSPIVTLAPGVAVPLTTTVGPAGLLPGVGPRISIVGTGRLVKLTGCEVVFDPGPAITVKVVGPTGTLTVQLNKPLPFETVLQSVTVPGPDGFGPTITTGIPGSVVPDTTGLVLVLVFVGWLTVRLGGVGATALLEVNVVTSGVLVPPGFVATTVTLTGPSGT
jgi:hypothetical protein